jgi:mannosyltransferase OCH1-like enzyme
MERISKTLHFIWIGDETRCPNNCIETWRDHHPGWDIRIWGNEELHDYPWINKSHMQAVNETGQLCGVADLMRWEILTNEGGVAIDADSVCLSPLPDWLLDCELFACWENEINRLGLISNGLVGCRPNNLVLNKLIDDLHQQKNIATRFIWYRLKRKRKSAWRTTGPQPFSRTLLGMQYTNATILPSHFSIPIHTTGLVYRGGGPVVCSQLFSGTNSSQYKEIYQLNKSELLKLVEDKLDS